MKALVIGSTGFIGSALCRALLAKGWQVRAFHRSTSLLKQLEGLPVEHFEGNISQPDTLEAAMQGIEAVFHAGGPFGRRDDPGQMYNQVVGGTKNILQAALEMKVGRVVLTSSAASLGVPDLPASAPRLSSVQPGLLDENHTWNYPPQYWYFGYAKYLAELEAQKTIAAGLDVVIVNPCFTLGAGDIYRKNTSLLVRIARQQIPGVVLGGINAVHLDDVVEGHLAALEHGKCGERYVLGGENLAYSELLRKFATVAGKPTPRLLLPAWGFNLFQGGMKLLRPFIDYPLAPDLLRMAGRYFYYNTQKAQASLGFSASHSLDDAIREAYNWFVQAGAIQEG